LADAKLEIKAGTISFTGEGSEAWLGEQLDKVLTKLSELRDHSADSGDGADEDEETDQKQAKTPKGAQVKIAPLAAYLKEKKATTNQARKFLATAAWLQLGGMNRVSTAEVTKNLNTHNQGKLTNPGQCLINNAKNGNVVKDGKQFYVADKGFEELGK
jgi:hypothetical protein